MAYLTTFILMYGDSHLCIFKEVKGTTRFTQCYSIKRSWTSKQLGETLKTLYINTVLSIFYQFRNKRQILICFIHKKWCILIRRYLTYNKTLISCHIFWLEWFICYQYVLFIFIFLLLMVQSIQNCNDFLIWYCETKLKFYLPLMFHS